MTNATRLRDDLEALVRGIPATQVLASGQAKIFTSIRHRYCMWSFDPDLNPLIPDDLDEEVREIIGEEVGRLPSLRAKDRIEPPFDEENPDDPDWYAAYDSQDYLEWLANLELDEPSTLEERDTAVQPRRPGEIRFTNENAQRGYDFEKWVVIRFDRKRLSLVEWTSDKGVDGWTPQSSMRPDLVFSYLPVGAPRRRLFAVECKWRGEYWQGSVQWSDEKQIDRYLKIGRRIPVFVVIGVGGTPNDPREVYLVPLKGLPRPFVSHTDLQPYLRTPAGAAFVWNEESEQLS